MKKKISGSWLAAIAAVTLLSGCDENAWNDHLDGFDSNYTPTEVKTIDYTLTDADYKAIASNSTNTALAGDEFKSQLEAVGKQFCFNADITASKYVPAFLQSTSFAYFTLSDGSAVKVTYRQATDANPELAAAQAARAVLLTDADYQSAWNNGDDYIAAFAPSVSASKNLPKLLRNIVTDAQSGEYAMVTYAETDQEPVFGNVGGGDDPNPGYVMSSSIGSAANGDAIEVTGIVTGVCTRGYVVTDASGSMFVYVASGFVAADYPIGSQITVSGTVGNYNAGLQLSVTDSEITGFDASYAAPADHVFTGAELDVLAAQYAADKAAGPYHLAQYGSVTGTVAVNGNNINIKDIDGATTAQGSAYFTTDDLKARLTDGSAVTMKGWLIAVASGRYCNFVVTDVEPATTPAAAVQKAPVAPVTTKVCYGLYAYNGSSWAVAANVSVLQPADYRAMGQNYDNLSGEAPATLLPKYLASAVPYAAAGDTRIVAYYYYADKVTSLKCDEYEFDGTVWTAASNMTEETAQFVKTGGRWMFDPNVTITLPAGKNQEMSMLYYQTCVDWVKSEVPDGAKYVTSYGNNEYYSGTSAYQGNVDLRADSARGQYAAGYEGMDDAQIVALMKSRFESEVFPAALGVLHADAAPIEGLQVLYTVNFSAYDGLATTPYVAVYEVTGPGVFTLVSCSWND